MGSNNDRSNSRLTETLQLRERLEPIEGDLLLSTAQAAAYLNLKVRTLIQMRFDARRGNPHGPPWVTIGSRRYVYSRKALDQWLENISNGKALNER